MDQAELRILIRGRKVERDVVNGDVGAACLFFPVLRCKFAAEEGQHHGKVGPHLAFDLAADRVRTAGAAEAIRMIWHGQADYVFGKLEILRLHERGDLDLDAGLAVVAAQQRQHDRRLFRSPVADIAAKIGDRAVRDGLVGFGIRPACGDIGRGQSRPTGSKQSLSEAIEARLNRRRGHAAQIGPPVVEHDVGRILRKRHVVVEPVGAVIHDGLIRPARALRERHRQTLLSLLERHRVAGRIRVHKFLPAIGGQQLACRGGRDRDHGWNAIGETYFGVAFAIRLVRRRAFELRQCADIDQPVIGAGVHRRSRTQHEDERQQRLPCRDQCPARRSKHSCSPVFADAWFASYGIVGRDVRNAMSES